MDRNILKKYDALKDEQTDIRERVRRLKTEMSGLLETVASDVVMGTREDGTYGPIKIKGIPFPEYDRKRDDLQKRIARYEEISAELSSMVTEVEVYIAAVSDPRVRTIMRLKYVDGLSWRDIGRRYGKGPSWAFWKVRRYLEAGRAPQ